jgi:UDP-2,4-diacetamido-2,4,6-trideoxy-beta-L-altropyranose hydrolase
MANFGFRVDASLEIGHGHLMRCLTLANELKKRSNECFFITNKLDPYLKDKALSMGHEIYNLPTPNAQNFNWKKDALLTQEILKKISVSWLIVDHYLIDKKWETIQRKNSKNIMVIDDLLNREHECDLLLDQNIGRTNLDYCNLVPQSASLIAGLNFSLIGEEFLKMREESIRARNSYSLNNILVTMGGSDPKNLTTKALKDIAKTNLNSESTISVILQKKSQNVSVVKSILKNLPFASHLFFDVDDMSKILAAQDLVIGAMGISVWERCCLGIPSISMVVEDSQDFVAETLHLSRASIVVNRSYSDGYSIQSAIDYFSSSKNLKYTSEIAANLVDGQGAKRVVDAIDKHSLRNI